MKSKAPNIRSRQELERLLKANGINRCSKSCQDYTRAKQLFTAGEWIDQAIYEDLIKYTLDYIVL